jgi:hypothetical protein
MHADRWFLPHLRLGRGPAPHLASRLQPLDPGHEVLEPSSAQRFARACTLDPPGGTKRPAPPASTSPTTRGSMDNPAQGTADSDALNAMDAEEEQLVLDARLAPPEPRSATGEDEAGGIADDDVMADVVEQAAAAAGPSGGSQAARAAAVNSLLESPRGSRRGGRGEPGEPAAARLAHKSFYNQFDDDLDESDMKLEKAEAKK